MIPTSSQGASGAPKSSERFSGNSGTSPNTPVTTKVVTRDRVEHSVYRLKQKQRDYSDARNHEMNDHVKARAIRSLAGSVHGVEGIETGDLEVLTVGILVAMPTSLDEKPLDMLRIFESDTWSNKVKTLIEINGNRKDLTEKGKVESLFHEVMRIPPESDLSTENQNDSASMSRGEGFGAQPLRMGRNAADNRTQTSSRVATEGPSSDTSGSSTQRERSPENSRSSLKTCLQSKIFWR
ncbi:hypothetical protein BCR34DRAFT_605647 [Clohesyomyces aquaticus]|uniref:Uncharacterized protein n=1 Tax=Clohesyomyces aquaticus TaxID=1231657 RepID=A0A1Y1YWH4_9PLEO|nr:hypothetical protein BCR34DRAFT_605647 [Clohesyomyces aquaticus]